jgi:hypothetical protein
MDEDEHMGRNAGHRWAVALLENKGLKWIADSEIDAGASEWDAFKRYASPNPEASDRDIFEAMFEERSAKFIAAFVEAALSVLRGNGSRPH